jgi:hypothetical protein
VQLPRGQLVAKWKSVILAHLKIAQTMLSAILLSAGQGSKERHCAMWPHTPFF